MTCTSLLRGRNYLMIWLSRICLRLSESQRKVYVFRGRGLSACTHTKCAQPHVHFFQQVCTTRRPCVCTLTKCAHIQVHAHTFQGRINLQSLLLIPVLVNILMMNLWAICSTIGQQCVYFFHMHPGDGDSTNKLFNYFLVIQNILIYNHKLF